MLIVTAGSDHNPKYKITIPFCEESCKKRGYKFQAYDLGGLGFGTPVSDERMSSRFKTLRYAIKPELILRSLNETEEEFVVWIDGDATLIGSLDELESDDSFDVGVTVRPKSDNQKTTYINAGVLFFKNNEASNKFLQDWILAMGPAPLDTETDPKEYCDQHILESKLIMPAIGIPLWDIIGETHTVHGARIKILPCLQYNNFMCVNKRIMTYDTSIRIIHYKGRHWGPGKMTTIDGQQIPRVEAYYKLFLEEHNE